MKLNLKNLYVEYERSIVSMLLSDSNEYKEVIVNSLEPEMFMDETNKLIFEACKFLKAKGSVINKYSLLEFIGDAKFEQILTELYDEFITSVNYSYFIEKIRTNYLNRMVQTAQTIDDLEKIEAIKGDTIESGGLVSIGYNSDILVGDYYSKADTAISTGYKCLDNVLGSLRGGDFVILAGATAMGKSMMMLNLIDNMACRNHKVALFSLEMSIQSLQNRLICKNTGINASKYRAFAMTELEARAYQEFADKLKYYPIFANKEYKFDVQKIKRYCKKCQPDVVFIDYLGLIQDTKNNKSKYEKVSDISTGLKQLALELNVPIIALQQLSRGVESRNDKRPILADLRDSGQIEQDADVIMFCYRPNYYDRDNANTDAKEFQLIIAKNRNGKAGVTVPLRVNLSTQEITEQGVRHVIEIVK